MLHMEFLKGRGELESRLKTLTQGEDGVVQGGASVIGDGVSAGISHISGSGWDTCGRLGEKGSIQREVGRHRHIINRPVISGSSLLQRYHDDGGSGS